MISFFKNICIALFLFTSLETFASNTVQVVLVNKVNATSTPPIFGLTAVIAGQFYVLYSTANQVVSTTTSSPMSVPTGASLSNVIVYTSLPTATSPGSALTCSWTGTSPSTITSNGILTASISGSSPYTCALSFQ